MVLLSSFTSKWERYWACILLVWSFEQLHQQWLVFDTEVDNDDVSIMRRLSSIMPSVFSLINVWHKFLVKRWLKTLKRRRCCRHWRLFSIPIHCFERSAKGFAPEIIFKSIITSSCLRRRRFSWHLVSLTPLRISFFFLNFCPFFSSPKPHSITTLEYLQRSINHLWS